MATTAAIIKTNTEYDSYFWVKWSQTSQSIADNTTKISWSCGVYCGHSFYSNAITMSAVTINGTQVYAGGTYSNYNRGDHTIASGTLTISHSGDGTKSFTVAAFTGWLYASHNYSAAAQSFTLNTIPRASTMTVPSFTIGSAGTLTITRASSSFTHAIAYWFGTVTGQAVAVTSDTSVSWTPPLSLLNQIPNSPSGTGTLRIYTYNGGTLIGSKDYTFTAQAGANIKPSCSFTAADAEGLLDTYGGYVQGKSRVTIATAGSQAYGSPIKSYSVTVDGKTYSGDSVTTDPLVGTGSLTIRATVTDARGRTSDPQTQTITVLPYKAPVVTLTAYRCTSAGTQDAEGAYMKLSVSADISSLGNHNSATYAVKYKKSAEESWTNLTGSGTAFTSAAIAADVASIYNIEATITDKLESTTKADTIPIAFVLMDFYSTGKGIAFGQVADRDGFMCAMPAKFSKGAVIGARSVIPTSRTATLNNLMYPLDIPGGLIKRTSSDCNLRIASLESQFGSKAVGYKPTGSEVEATWQPRSSSAGLITPHLIPSHIYYACVWARQNHGLAGSIDLYWPISEPAFFSNKTLSATRTWQKISGRTSRSTFTEGDYPLRLDYNNNGSTETMYFAAIALYDLTATFGEGKEPDLAWCDANLDYEKQSIDVDDPTYEITPQLISDCSIYMGGPNGQTEELGVFFSNPADSKYHHACHLYGGNPNSTTGIGMWDDQNSRGVLFYNDVDNSINLGEWGTNIILAGMELLLQTSLRVISNMSLLNNMPTGFSGYGRAIMLGKTTDTDKYYLLLDRNGKLYTGRELNGATTITWLTV